MARLGQYKALGASLGSYKKTLGKIDAMEYAKGDETSKSEFNKAMYSSVGTAIANVVGIVQEKRELKKLQPLEKPNRPDVPIDSQELDIIDDVKIDELELDDFNYDAYNKQEDIHTRSQRIIDENEALYQKTIAGGEIKSEEQLTPLEGLPTTDIGGREFTNLTGPQLPVDKSPYIQDPKDYKPNPSTLNPTDSSVFDALADPLSGDLDTDTQYSSPIEKLMLTKSEFKKSGANKDKLDELIDVIGTVESGNQNIAQIGGGPGRGIFQFETGEGKGMDTALNRIIRMYTEKEHLGQDTYPSWIKDAKNPNHENYLDATKLNPSQQRELLIADLYMKKGSDKNLKKAFSTGDYKDLWLENHWAGADEDKESKSAYYDSVMSNYKTRRN